MKKTLTKVTKTKRVVHTRSTRSTASAWLAGWDCTLACGHVVFRMASGRCAPPDRAHCKECACANLEVQP